MTGKTHLMAGLASLWLLPPSVLSPHSFGVCVISAGIGSLLPDLDSAKNLLSTFSVFKIRPFVPLTYLINGSLGHRGALHSFAGAFVVGWLVGIPLATNTQGAALWAILAGFVSHLALDCLTVRGLRLMWPKYRSYYLVPQRLRIVTGSDFESLYFMLFAMLVFSLLFRLLLTF